MNNLEDNILFENSILDEKVIFNRYTFLTIIKGCIVKYACKNEEDAEELLRSSYLYKLPETFEDVVFLSHEHEYHWAMVICFGEEYWQINELNITSVIPESYDSWEEAYISKYNLSNGSFEYL